jgi:hypothetical protein
MRKRQILIASVVLVLAACLPVAVVMAQDLFICQIVPGANGHVTIDCDPYVATPEATATPVPTDTPIAPTATAVPTAIPTVIPPAPTPTMVHDMAMMLWHPPGSHSGIPAHDHGDQPPPWIGAAGYTVTFDHPGNTPNENVLPHKHTARKGYAATLKGVNVYCVWHLDFNPGGAASRFHSYQCWFQDAAGGVSNANGWLDFGSGNSTTGNVVAVCGADNGQRPIIMENGYGCAPLLFSTWYARAGASLIDVGFSVSPSYYLNGPGGAAVDPLNPATWFKVPGGNNLTRRMELALYANRLNQYPKSQEFWTDQFWRRVSGPNDPACGTTVTLGAKTYPVVCLRQYLSSTLTEIAFPGNAIQRTFPGPVVLPN